MGPERGGVCPKGHVFEVPIEEDKVIFEFKNRDWRLIQYLVST